MSRIDRVKTREFRMHLAEMIQSAKNHPVQVTNRKRTIAVLISPEDYEVLKQLRVHKQLSV